MSVALYRKYRSKSLKEVVGQPHVTDLLEAAIKNNSVGHAYLLTGPRGVGKTSVARILAHEVNGLPYKDESSHLDIIEIDAASNNGIENIRDLRDKARIAPSLAKYKVYIIDEVHMLSGSAFNGLLKILEEPPKHVIFILATTDYHKLPDTIISRTQRFNFRLISEEDLVKHLKFIAKSEKIDIDDEALKIIARRGRGSFRDSISLLDQLQSGSDKITAKSVNTSLGLAPLDKVNQLIDSAHSLDHETVIKIFNELLDAGVNPNVIADQLIAEIRVRLAKQPQLVYMLQKLSEVDKASHPDITLLLALLPKAGDLAPAAQAPATAKNTAPQTQASPVVAQKIVLPDTTPPIPIQNTPPAPKPVAPTPTPAAPAPKPAAKPTITEEPKPTPAPEFNGEPGSLDDFDWKAVTEKAGELSLGLNSILASCGYEIIDNTLHLYTGGTFKKNKLESARIRPLLSQAVNHATRGEVPIEIHGTQKPPSDSGLAKVAELMGGGEEVDVS